jgi:hypothetical protein
VSDFFLEKVKAGDKQYYQPTDENIDKNFQYITDKKWMK